jgi:cytochrome c oxidase subunit 4
MDSRHADSPAIYAKILATLLALTVITVLAAGVNFGSGNVVIALVIASIKGSLVALFFMHLRHEKPMSAVIFVSGLAMLAVFLIFSTIDSGARRENQIRPSTTSPAFRVRAAAPGSRDLSPAPPTVSGVR